LETPENFKNNLERTLFNCEDICEIVRKVWQETYESYKALAPNCTVKLYWILPKDVEGVAMSLQNRNTFESEFEFNYINYITNQNYLFRRLHEITKVGDIYEVNMHITYTDILNMIGM
jgi:hypothetical protein